ncbi:hypothetical protein T4A_12605 [Trichinella pseudospiralis]|uniref:Uncharacterized protein n=1 Tax=Trichinella pseudospiralis TaxID=6337 RepID=A0A0V1DS85_TRIPS|nr:hypothetical protein T4A_12605 [Trichinella pseudospiralis]KRY80277.1 hypothetical protein T4D_5530 [Trichinella pseudospiralis]
MKNETLLFTILIIPNMKEHNCITSIGVETSACSYSIAG